MRIISKFHDYYDNAMAFGQDESVVYARERLEFDARMPSDARIAQLKERLLKSVERRYEMIPVSYHGKYGQMIVTLGAVVFCAKTYLLARAQFIPTGSLAKSPASSDHCFYSAQALLEHMVSHGINVDEKRYKVDTSVEKRITRRFAAVAQSDPQWFIENKVSVALLMDGKVVINPVLKDIEFYKVFDPYGAYQELDMWISGTLAWPQNFMIEVSDKDRINQHGFDPVYGFRTRPRD